MADVADSFIDVRNGGMCEARSKSSRESGSAASPVRDRTVDIAVPDDMSPRMELDNSVALSQQGRRDSVPGVRVGAPAPISGGPQPIRRSTMDSAKLGRMKSIMKAAGSASLMAGQQQQRKREMRWKTLFSFTRLDTSWRLTWTLVLLPAILYTAIDSSWGLVIVPADIFEWRIAVDIACLFLFGIDAALGLVTPQYDRRMCTWRSHPPEIRRLYLRSSLVVLDLIPCIPVEYVVLIAHEHGRLYQGLRCFRGFVKAYKGHYYLNPSTAFPGLIEQGASGQRPIFQFFKLSWLIYWMVLPLHYLTCASCGTRVAYDESCDYIEQMYFSLYTLTSVGYGDVANERKIQKIWAMAMMLLGTVLLGVVIGWISENVVSKDSVASSIESHCQEMASLLDHYEVPETLRREILSFHMHYLENNVYKSHEQSIALLPDTMQDKIVLCVRSKLIGMVPMFQKVTSQCREELAAELDQDTVDPGTILIKTGELGTEMFFLSHGLVEVLIETDSGPKQVHVIQKGGFFGEMALLWEQPRAATIRAITYCDLFILGRKAFLDVALRYPEFEEVIREEIQKRTQGKPRETVLDKLKVRKAEMQAQREAGDMDTEALLLTIERDARLPALGRDIPRVNTDQDARPTSLPGLRHSPDQTEGAASEADTPFQETLRCDRPAPSPHGSALAPRTPPGDRDIASHFSGAQGRSGTGTGTPKGTLATRPALAPQRRTTPTAEANPLGALGAVEPPESGHNFDQSSQHSSSGDTSELALRRFRSNHSSWYGGLGKVRRPLPQGGSPTMIAHGSWLGAQRRRPPPGHQQQLQPLPHCESANSLYSSAACHPAVSRPESEGELLELRKGIDRITANSRAIVSQLPAMQKAIATLQDKMDSIEKALDADRRERDTQLVLRITQEVANAVTAVMGRQKRLSAAESPGGDSRRRLSAGKDDDRGSETADSASPRTASPPSASPQRGGLHVFGQRQGARRATHVPQPSAAEGSLEESPGANVRKIASLGA